MHSVSKRDNAYVHHGVVSYLFFHIQCAFSQLRLARLVI